MFSVFNQDEEHMAAVHTSHSLSGALRSGEGSYNSLTARVKLFEESNLLDQIEETGEIVTDMHL